jgi:hypothetical protein
MFEDDGAVVAALSGLARNLDVFLATRKMTRIRSGTEGLFCKPLRRPEFPPSRNTKGKAPAKRGR